MNRTSPPLSLMTLTTRTPCIGVSAVSSKNSLKSSMQTFQITRMRSRENTRWWIRRFSGGRRCIQDQRDCEFCAAVAALRWNSCDSGEASLALAWTNVSPNAMIQTDWLLGFYGLIFRLYTQGCIHKLKENNLAKCRTEDPLLKLVFGMLTIGLRGGSASKCDHSTPYYGFNLNLVKPELQGVQTTSPEFLTVLDDNRECVASLISQA